MESSSEEINNSIRTLWIPLQKSLDSSYNGILSDTSIDRDNEKMSPDLLHKWANDNFNGIPTLINHENKIQSIAGGWKDLRVIASDNGGNQALVGNFHAIKSNPHTSWIPDVIKDMDELGIPVGVSITAIPKNFKKGNLEKDGYDRMWTDAELVEATLVPIQSNRSANISGYKSIAKSFSLNLEEKSCSSINDDNHQEVIDMAEEIKKEVPETPEEVIEEPKEEIVTKEIDDDEEEQEDVPNPLEEKMAKLEETLAKQAETIEKLKKEKVAEMKKADMKGNFEQTSVERTPATLISKSEYSLFDMLSL